MNLKATLITAICAVHHASRHLLRGRDRGHRRNDVLVGTAATTPAPARGAHDRPFGVVGNVRIICGVRQDKVNGAQATTS